MTDTELVKRCLRGDARGQRKLYEQFAGKMLFVCRRYARDMREAEDMLQEAFMRVFSSLRQYRAEGSLEGWVRRIVVTTALGVVRQKKLPFAAMEEEVWELPSDESDVLDKMSTEELMKLIGELPDGYRVVFNLNVIDGYGHQEIAEMLGITANTSRSQLLKARRFLRLRILRLQQLAERYERS